MENKEIPIYWKGVLIGYTEDKLSFRITSELGWKKMLLETEGEFALISSHSQTIDNFYNILKIEQPENFFSNSIFVGHQVFDQDEYGDSNKRFYLKRYKRFVKEGLETKKFLGGLHKESRKLFLKTMKHELPLYKKVLIRLKTKIRIWKINRRNRNFLKQL